MQNINKRLKWSTLFASRCAGCVAGQKISKHWFVYVPVGRSRNLQKRKKYKISYFPFTAVLIGKYISTQIIYNCTPMFRFRDFESMPKLSVWCEKQTKNKKAVLSQVNRGTPFVSVWCSPTSTTSLRVAKLWKLGFRALDIPAKKSRI